MSRASRKRHYRARRQRRKYNPATFTAWLRWQRERREELWFDLMVQAMENEAQRLMGLSAIPAQLFGIANTEK